MIFIRTFFSMIPKLWSRDDDISHILHQLNSTLLLASCMTLLFRQLLLSLIEDDSHNYWGWYLYTLFKMISKLRSLDHDIFPSPAWFHFAPCFLYNIIKTTLFSKKKKKKKNISINDWLPFKYFLRQLDSTLLLASHGMIIKTISSSTLIHVCIEDDSHIEDNIDTHFLKWFPNDDCYKTGHFTFQ